MTTLAPAAPVGLLGSWHALHRADLRAHLETYGPLPRPSGADPGWTARLAAEIEASGLTGRGGAAFPAACKLAGVARAGGHGTVVVNAMEGEPASDKDRVLLGVAPHLVLDGAELVAGGIGAQRIVVCIASDRDDTARRLADALAERPAGAKTGTPVEIARPPGRYVGGEESALVSWLDGGAPAPSFRVDKSVPLAVRGRPVVVHNAETLAHIALIARYGAGWFRARGTPDAPGTTLVTVSGAVDHPGVHEIALGTPIDEIVSLSGPGQVVGAVLVGGYGGTWIGSDDLGTRYAPGPLARLGAGTGAGVLVVLGREACGVAVAARIADYMAGQSAGQCGPCVFGLPALAEDMRALAGGSAAPATVERLRGRFAAVEGRGACRHPDGVVRMLRSALVVFADDLSSHAAGVPCPYSRDPLPTLEPAAGHRGGTR